MTPSELRWLVTRDVCALGAALAVLGGWLGGVPWALGVAAGVLLAVGNFRVLVAHACASPDTPGTARALWSMGAGLRFVGLAVLSASLLTSGWAHPVALVAGLTALPCALVGHGLRAARQES